MLNCLLWLRCERNEDEKYGKRMAWQSAFGKCTYAWSKRIRKLIEAKNDVNSLAIFHSAKQMLTHSKWCGSEWLNQTRCDHRNTIFAYENWCVFVANVRISPDINVKFNYNEEIIPFVFGSCCAVLFVFFIFFSQRWQIQFSLSIDIAEMFNAHITHFMDFHNAEIQTIWKSSDYFRFDDNSIEDMIRANATLSFVSISKVLNLHICVCYSKVGRDWVKCVWIKRALINRIHKLNGFYVANDSDWRSVYRI